MQKLKRVFKKGSDREPLGEKEGIVEEAITRGNITRIRLERDPNNFVIFERHRFDAGERVRLFYDRLGNESVIKSYEISDMYRKILYRHVDSGYEFEVGERDDFF